MIPSNINGHIFKGGSAPSYDFGNALDFGNAVDMKVTTDASSSTNQHTISFWINPHDVSAIGTILAKQNVTNRYLTITETYIRQKWGAGVVTHNFNANLVAGNWYHFFITRDGVNYRCWINGIESPSGTVTGVNTSDGYNMFGANHTTEYLDAIVDDLYYLKGTVGTEQNAIDIAAGADPSVIMGSNGFYHFDFNTESGNDTPINLGSASGVTAVNFPPTGNYIAH